MIPADLSFDTTYSLFDRLLTRLNGNLCLKIFCSQLVLLYAYVESVNSKMYKTLFKLLVNKIIVQLILLLRYN